MLKKYLKDKLKIIILFCVFFVVFLATFALFKLPVRATIYPAVICAIIGIAIIVVDYYRVKKSYECLLNVEQMVSDIEGNLPEPSSVIEEEYQKIAGLLLELQRQTKSDYSKKYNNMMEYFTIWVHQIKLPIAVMRMNIENEDSEFARKTKVSLSRIEAYVEMVLTFLRLEADSTDYLIKTCSLDDIVRGELRRFSSEFIEKKLQLEFSPTGLAIVTDEKWLGFVIGQVISNALKYTKSGTIRIYGKKAGDVAPSGCASGGGCAAGGGEAVRDGNNSPSAGAAGGASAALCGDSAGGASAAPGGDVADGAGDVLCIEDTGIGIMPEDLPRIFENGFTGFQGREDRRASGIGLYLCRRICTELGHEISAEAEPGRGTKILIKF